MDDDAQTIRPASSNHSEMPVESASSPGILVLTTSLQLLYMNSRARTLCGQLTAHRTGLAAHGIVPTEVLELCDDLVKTLSVQPNLKDWEQSQFTCQAGGADSPVLLRGMGLPDGGGLANSRLLILMEVAAPPPASTVTFHVRERFQLTGQEERVISFLSKGFTNKEIANQLTVTEQTVKEHLRHIMQKTATTTRTGVLAKVLFPEPVADTRAPRALAAHAKPA